LLPGWSEDWIILEREHIRQRLLHALEALSRHLVEAGRYAEAVDAAVWAVGAGPLRESGIRVLIEAHLAEGNLVEARQVYEVYASTLRRELGIEPGRQLAGLVRAEIRPLNRPRAALNTP
jgi:DNA-binding SARP family transcriptional activator